MIWENYSCCEYASPVATVYFTLIVHEFFFRLFWKKQLKDISTHVHLSGCIYSNTKLGVDDPLDHLIKETRPF